MANRRFIGLFLLLLLAYGVALTPTWWWANQVWGNRAKGQSAGAVPAVANPFASPPTHPLAQYPVFQP